MRRLVPVALAAAVGCGGEPAIPNKPPVVVIGTDRTIAPGTEIELNGSSSTDPDGTIVDYAWNFDDGTSASGVIVRHAWTEERVYAVTLTVTDNRGAESTDAISVTVTSGNNLQPTVTIRGPSEGGPGETLSFDGSRSTDPDGELVAFNWDFGDGTTGTGTVVEHAFAIEGTFTVTLDVVDNRGGAGRGSRDVVISMLALNLPPTAVAGPDQSVTVNMPVTVDGSGSSDPDGNIVSYRWDFGDGTTSNSPRAMHTYGQVGQFVVTLTVTDDGGATGEASKLITVTPPLSYDGTWLLNPLQATVQCMNTRTSYIVPFPVMTMMLNGTQNATISAVVGGTTRVMTGAIDRTVSPPRLSLSWVGSHTDVPGNYPAACGTAEVRHSITAYFTAEDRITGQTPGGAEPFGRFTTIFSWSGAGQDSLFCQCSQTFDFGGAKQ